MPKVSEARREERRAQILHAAWTCFQRQGLHVTSMDDIIAASGLSAGAVYTYFKSKDDLILAAITTSLSGLKSLLGEIVGRSPPPPPDALLRELTGTIADFSARGDFDLRRLALLGWSEAQRDRRIAALIREFYLEFRSTLTKTALHWRKTGAIKRTADVDAAAKALMALLLGFVAQSALLGDVTSGDMDAGLGALSKGPATTRARSRARG